MALKSAADFAVLLQGLHNLKDDGVVAIILPHVVLFRGGKEYDNRKKLLDNVHIDTVVDLPANLCYSKGIPVCILVLKKCKKPDDVPLIGSNSSWRPLRRDPLMEKSAATTGRRNKVKTR